MSQRQQYQKRPHIFTIMVSSLFALWYLFFVLSVSTNWFHGPVWWSHYLLTLFLFSLYARATYTMLSGRYYSGTGLMLWGGVLGPQPFVFAVFFSFNLIPGLNFMSPLDLPIGVVAVTFALIVRSKLKKAWVSPLDELQSFVARKEALTLAKIADPVAAKKGFMPPICPSCGHTFEGFAPVGQVYKCTQCKEFFRVQKTVVSDGSQ